MSTCRIVRSGAIGESEQLGVKVSPATGDTVLPLPGCDRCGRTRSEQLADAVLQRFANPLRAHVEQRVCLIGADPSPVDHHVVGIVDMQLTGMARGLEHLCVQRHVSAHEFHVDAVQHVGPVADDDRRLLDDFALQRFEYLFAGVDDSTGRAPVE